VVICVDFILLMCILCKIMPDVALIIFLLLKNLSHLYGMMITGLPVYKNNVSLNVVTESIDCMHQC
jgi:hypothetical protein